MAVLMNVGKPLQTSDNIFMTEWVAIFRESGLRDDVTVAHLQDACLKLVVLARARARELQVDQQVERAQQPLSAKTAIPTTKPKPKSAPTSDKPVCRFFLKPDGCKNGDNCQYAHPRTNGKCLQCGSKSHNLQACTRPRRQQSSRSESVKPASKKTYAKPKGKAADNQGYQEKKKSKGKSKGKRSQTKRTAKSGEVDFDEDAQADPVAHDEDQALDEPHEDDPEAYLIAAATSSSESEEEQMACVNHLFNIIPCPWKTEAWLGKLRFVIKSRLRCITMSASWLPDAIINLQDEPLATFMFSGLTQSVRPLRRKPTSCFVKQQGLCSHSNFLWTGADTVSNLIWMLMIFWMASSFKII